MYVAVRRYHPPYIDEGRMSISAGLFLLLKSVRNWCMGRLFMQSNSPVWLSLYIDVEEIPITQRTEVKIPQAVGRRHTD